MTRTRRTLLDRAADLALDRSRHVSLLIAVGYVAALLGLGLGLLGGLDRPTRGPAAVAIALLFVSFLSLFYVSVTVVAVREP